MGKTDIDVATISRFGKQWVTYTENEGYYASRDCLADIFGPLLPIEQIANCKICDIGSGTGRIVNMLCEAGAKQVTAIEPSLSFEVLRKNTLKYSNKLELLNTTGENIPQHANFDLVISIGVLHHIVNPYPVVKAAFKALKPGGKMLIWLYGYEGNKLYLFFIGFLRRLTTRLPHKILAAVCGALNTVLDVYLALCRFLPLPMRAYCNQHLRKMNRQQRMLTIYDQLNPSFAKYYKEEEARALLAEHGFINVQLYHRHGYSWTVMGERPT